ncbi:MAG: hypothetical protein GWN84_20590 [Gammaproteobacteria bacterium]|nr:hypothetical protein [Gammaproteobacteria bacterium]NIR85160.1 hypothetical protein [Gammaproteobacteria bacterium]NIU06209.1 hypothetical protein [Gammaproteobacteria bacterium]NIX87482.1 hypothetical protein [Gammaproteobacteria bacterium]
MALDVLDGLGAATKLKSTVEGSDHIPHHNIDEVKPATTPRNGEKLVATAGTAVTLVGASTIVKSGVRIKARKGNTGTVYIGDSNVDSTNGYPLEPGESEFVEIEDLQSIYIDADNNSDGVRYFAT